MKRTAILILLLIPATLAANWYQSEMIYNNDFGFLFNIDSFDSTYVICDNEKIIFANPSGSDVFFYKEFENIKSPQIKTVAKLKDEYYCGSYNGILIYNIKNKSWKVITSKNSELPNDYINNLTVFDNKIYVNSDFSGISTIENDKIINYSMGANAHLVPSYNLNEIYFQNQLFYFSLTMDLVKFEDEKTDVVFSSDYLNEEFNITSNSIINGFIENNNKLYFLTDDNRIFSFDSKKIEELTAINEKLPGTDSIQITSFNFDSNGNTILLAKNIINGEGYILTANDKEVSYFNYMEEFNLEQYGRIIKKDALNDLFFYNNVKFFSNGNPELNVENDSYLYKYKLFPNPTDSYLKCQFFTISKTLNDVDVKIYTIEGIECKILKPNINFNSQTGLAHFDIDVSYLRKGFYFLVLKNKTLTIAYKFVKH